MNDEAMQVAGGPPPAWQNDQKTRDRAWERRRRQLRKRELEISNNNHDEHDLTDEDMSELKACIELGFGFCEEVATGQEKRKLSSTLPALDLYFAVNRGRTQPKGGMSPLLKMSSSSSSLSSLGSVVDSPSSSVGYSPTNDSDTWKIFNQGDDPKQVKIKLRHWAQAVACSVKQSQ